MHPIIKLLNKKDKFVIGLMSGTSMDGIDAALTRIQNFGPETKIELLHFETFAYPDDLRKSLLKIAESGETTAKQLCELNFVVGEYFADAALAICRNSRFDHSRIDLIGSHGQTIQHLPQEASVMNKTIRSTLQIGEPAIIANRVGCPTVGNFRSADIALGGQGAPLVPYVDYILFRSSDYNRVILNIGGIANITVLRRACESREVVAFDSGPGNMVIDAIAFHFYGVSYDDKGQMALKGGVSDQLLSSMLAHPYFSRPIPKSTGREEFGRSFVDQILAAARKLLLPPQDILATATELTARSIADAVKLAGLSITQVHELIVSGGGTNNQAIMKALARHFKNSRVLRSDNFQIPSDAKEAICFAILANETIAAIPANLPSVTGAQRPTVLGAIYFG